MLLTRCVLSYQLQLRQAAEVCVCVHVCVFVCLCVYGCVCVHLQPDSQVLQHALVDL